MRSNRNDAGPIVLVSDGTHGGAAIACDRLRRGLCAAGCDANWLALNGLRSKEVAIAATWPPLVPTLSHRLVMACTQSEWFRRWACDRVGDAAMLSSIRKSRPRVIHFHGIHEGMTFRLPERLIGATPLVWTLHDMWPITGYCCHSMECRKYESGCAGDCPQMGLWGKALTSPEREWRRRSTFLRAALNRLTLVAPSQWLAKCAYKRVPENVRVVHIPNGVDTKIFRPLFAKEFARQVLGLPSDSPVIMAGACSLGDRLKGAQTLSAALKQLKDSGVRFTFAAFGDSSVPLIEGEHRLGTVKDEVTLNLCYNAADVFVHPSLADNLPNVLVEAMAAGTPCVSSNVGGCPEIVEHGRTGFVAEVNDAEHVAASIHKVLSSSTSLKQAMSTACRESAERHYPLELQANRYASLYDEMTKCGTLPLPL